MFQAISINSSHCWCLPSLSFSFSRGSTLKSSLSTCRSGSSWEATARLSRRMAFSSFARGMTCWIPSREDEGRMAWIKGLNNPVAPLCRVGQWRGADIGASLTQLFLEGVGAPLLPRTWEDYLYFSLWILRSFPFSAWYWPWDFGPLVWLQLCICRLDLRIWLFIHRIPPPLKSLWVLE